MNKDFTGTEGNGRLGIASQSLYNGSVHQSKYSNGLTGKNIITLKNDYRGNNSTNKRK